MRWLASVVSPADTRVLYAYGIGIDRNYGVAKVPLYQVPDGSDATGKHCFYQNGLWRSLNRGFSWHPVVTQNMPNAGTLPGDDFVELSAAPNNPYAIMLGQRSSSDSAPQLFEAADAAHVSSVTELPKLDCQVGATPGEACPQCTQVNNFSPGPGSGGCIIYRPFAGQPQLANFDEVATDRCERKAHPNICQTYWQLLGKSYAAPPEKACGIDGTTGLTSCSWVANAQDPWGPICGYVPPWQASATVNSSTQLWPTTKTCIACQTGADNEIAPDFSNAEATPCCMNARPLDATQENVPKICTQYQSGTSAGIISILILLKNFADPWTLTT